MRGPFIQEESKIGKLLDGRRECEAHVILSLERHLHQAEATIKDFYSQGEDLMVFVKRF